MSNEDAGATPAKTEPQADAMPAWATELQAAIGSINGRLSKFGQDMGAIREKVKATAPAETKEAPPPQVLSRDEMSAARRFGAAVSKLSPEAAAYFDEREAAGASYTELLREAELLSKFGAQPPGATQASGGRDAAPGPRGFGATPPQPTTRAQWPRSQMAYAELVRKAKTGDAAAVAQAEALRNDPDFDDARLPLFG